MVRHGYGPELEIPTGIGRLAVRPPKIRDRSAENAEGRFRFSSTILPRWARRPRSLDALLPVLYLCGISTGDLQDAFAAPLGKNALNLSSGVLSRLTDEWETEYSC